MVKFKPTPEDKELSAEAVGERITRVRRDRRMTQQTVGELLNPPLLKQAIGQIEKGAVHVSYLRLVDIARVLRVSHFYLLTGQGTPDVVISPLKVVSGKSYPVQIVEHGVKPAEKRYIYVDREPDPSDRAVMVMDEAMAPEFRPGDETIFRNITPLPGDHVWAIDPAGNLLLRTYRQVRSGFELVAKNDLFAAVEGKDVEILGVVISLGRKFKPE